jgi:hypothetical protein
MGDEARHHYQVGSVEDFIYADAARSALRASIGTVRVPALRQQRRHCSRNLDRWSWADSPPTEVASGGPESGRKPAFRCEPEIASTAPSRHRPKPQQNVAMGGKQAGVRPRREFQSSVDHLPSTQSGNSWSALEATVPRINIRYLIGAATFDASLATANSSTAPMQPRPNWQSNSKESTASGRTAKWSTPRATPKAARSTSPIKYLAREGAQGRGLLRPLYVDSRRRSDVSNAQLAAIQGSVGERVKTTLNRPLGATS